MLYDQACKNKLQKIKISKEKANLFLQETPDFSFEMKWEVNVPFLSFLCPNDICKVWKQGINARMDYSFISFKNLQTIRSPSSFYYYGESGQSILLNWEKKTWFDQFEPLDEEEKSLIIDDIMNSSRLNSEFKLKNCQISQSISWRGKPIYEKIKEYNSNKYDVKVTTYFDLHNNEKREYYNLDKDVYFDQTKDLDSKLIIVKTIDEMKKNLAENLQVKNDMQKKLIENFGKSKEKTLSASVWIADNFPFKPIYLVNMINSLSSANEFIEKIKEFFKDPEVEKIIKNNGFPIRIRIPLNILVDITVTFYNFR